jgi:hypothetical protein
VGNVDCFDPLMWWVANESKFPNMGFLAWQILSILGSHLKLNGFSQLQMCSLVYNNVTLKLRILTRLSWYTRIGFQMHDLIAILLMETN